MPTQLIALRLSQPQFLLLIGTLLVLFSAPALALPTPEITARAAVLMNADSGEILFAKQPHTQLPPASTTKVLTALVALERLNLQERISVSARAAAVEPSRIGLQPGEVLYAQDLLYGLLLKSGNDAAEVIAEAVGGSVPGFADLMNDRAWQLGARRSRFQNPHGLPNEAHYSTAYDLTLIFRQAMANPLFADIVRTRSAGLRVEASVANNQRWRMVPVYNSNRLLVSYGGVQGGKTGYTRRAKNCFVGEANRGQVNLIVSALGSANRKALWKDVSAILDYGFAQYRLTRPASPVVLNPSPTTGSFSQGD
ncbi:MAG: D-alanyl-D-alanine carboxypeptidase family protein [Candidatus Competibacteraceae bacterium]|jgi:D-alanyl-D-alanine carboxypeptidase|nr:D-alanyl-D-alanine carboxypeptidase family protein [Candidatus Competibacteraceae bacterium]